VIREPAVAGLFYSSDPRALRKTIAACLEAREPRLSAKAIIGPHAGYTYSGAVAGSVYSRVHLPQRYIILGPNHTGRGAPMSLHPAGGWRTPLGVVPVDPDLNESLIRRCPLVRQDRAAHLNEHSIEVHLPFLQALLDEFSFAAVCVGTSELAALESLGHALAAVVQAAPEPVLLIASSDMTHFEPAEAAADKDRKAIERIIAVDPAGLHQTVHDHDISMCGYAPAVSVLTACRDLGASEGRLISYANSGDVSGDYSRVVGYAGFAIL